MRISRENNISRQSLTQVHFAQDRRGRIPPANGPKNEIAAFHIFHQPLEAYDMTLQRLDRNSFLTNASQFIPQ
jgi:hypothetical protein